MPLRRFVSRLPAVAAALLAALGLAAALAAAPTLPLPLLSAPPPPVRPPTAHAAPHDLPWDAGLTVDTQDRAAVSAFYREHYLPGQDVEPGWTGDVASCAPGETDAAFKQAVIRRVNFYRALAGAPAAVTLDEAKNRQAQAAALMMAVAGQLSHAPDPDWPCYSEDGRKGAGSSNLAGAFGPRAIDLYMDDPGDSNSSVGHRRWILRPTARHFGTGDVPETEGYNDANALFVFDNHMWEPFSYAEGTRDGFLAWPPAGFSPQELAWERWHFQYGGEPGEEIWQRFDDATVSVRQGETTFEPEINHRGHDYIVWTIPSELLPQREDDDATFGVTVADVQTPDGPRAFTYEVTLFLAAPHMEGDLWLPLVQP